MLRKAPGISPLRIPRHHPAPPGTTRHHPAPPGFYGTTRLLGLPGHHPAPLAGGANVTVGVCGACGAPAEFADRGFWGFLWQRGGHLASLLIVF